jgi:membrane protein
VLWVIPARRAIYHGDPLSDPDHGATVKPTNRALSSLRVRDARVIALSLWKRNALVEASAMAFSLFLAGIPLMALSGIVLAHVLRNEAQALWVVSSFVNMAPDEVRELVDGNIVRGADQSLAPVFLGGCLFLAAGAFHDAMTVFESALGAIPRRWLQKRAIAMGCVLVVLVVFVLAGFLFIAAVRGPFLVVAHWLELGHRTSPRLAAFFVVATVGVLFVAGFFRIAVRHKSTRPPVFAGALVTVAIGSFASVGFATYARTLANYAAFYGSLAAVTIFLVWLWLCCIALLVGAQVNAHLEGKKTAASAVGLDPSTDLAASE